MIINIKDKLPQQNALLLIFSNHVDGKKWDIGHYVEDNPDGSKWEILNSSPKLCGPEYIKSEVESYIYLDKDNDGLIYNKSSEIFPIKQDSLILYFPEIEGKYFRGCYNTLKDAWFVYVRPFSRIDPAPYWIDPLIIDN